ncbi:MAG: DNA polymerase III subunit gamma/tau [Candidatus Omnitrophica bacterium]|jgi:DNA polymerase-3 subunit gamma/tau|nr:DNA polymerase III subunit gamma/tau [Candidatus Omnitrophota bacterium]
MPYTVLALKWRPKYFDEIIGQSHIVDTLKSAIQNNRLAHAYLFSGPRGVGKTSTARILAKALNCKNGPTVAPCQTCPSCVDITNSRSLDVMEIDGASNRGIDEIRTLRESIKFSPSSGRYKIYIIDEVHMLTTEAFNALLKTLEEPPEFVKFIFATTQANKVLPTVISRCQRFDFRRITNIEIIKQLEKILQAEKIHLDKEVLFAIAKSSDGALRDAESILDQVVSFCEGKVSLGDVTSILGLVEQDTLFEITQKIISRDSLAALELMNQIIDQGKDINVFLQNMVEHYRNLMVAKISGADAKLIDLSEEVCQRLGAQAQGLGLEEIFTAFNVLMNASEMARRMDSQRIPLEIALAKLSYDKNKAAKVAPSQVVEAPKKPHAHVEIKKSESDNTEIKKLRVPHQERIIENKPLFSKTFDEVRDVWAGVIDSLAKVKISVATYLSEGQPFRIDKDILTVAFPKNYSLHKESLERKENKTLIEKSLTHALGEALRVNFILTEKEIHRHGQDTQVVKSALDAFGGRVIQEI